ncbi:sulfotransferase [Acidocella sp.]|uniref:sulfotransferase n=1 Tax=Acidocella sp. TaxID=50710 RepID=UPI003D04662E
MPDAIFIVGYYRSGTSALSGALQRAGVKFYNDADPNEHNPLGFYEIPELIELDVDIFNRLAVDWTDVRGLPQGWQERADIAPLLSRLEEILRRRFTPRDRLWGLKHPHLCRTLPLYERAARQAGHRPHIVHIFRDPWTTAASQCRKNGLSRAHALLLWMSYATDAERQARHLPRSWLTYHDLLAQPVAQLRRIETELGLSLSGRGNNALAQAGAYLTAQLNRSEPLPSEGLSQTLRQLVTRTWEAVQDRNFTPALWDELTADTADLVGFLNEIGNSRGRALPAFGSAAAQTLTFAALPTALRPPERTDDGAQARLAALRAEAGPLPRLAVLVAAPAGRAHAVNETLESLRGQWAPPDIIKVLSVDSLHIEGIATLAVTAEPEAMTRRLCAELNLCAGEADYVAILNAGDSIAPDGCLRFALLAARTQPDLLYSDEIVPHQGGAWIRRKPGWDVTRLRQAAYIGDWVWYGAQAVRAAGGFNPDYAGAEEYDMQLRLAARDAKVERLPEALFTRSPQSRRDDIAPQQFCARAAAALTRHLESSGMKAEVQNRQHPGLFHHVRTMEDPGTAILMLCDGADLGVLDKWLTALLSGRPLTGPVILAGATDLSPQMTNYLTAVAQQSEALQGLVRALIAPSQGAALAQALALTDTPLVAILDARMQEVTPHWLEGLRARLADQGVAAVAARTLTPAGMDGRQGQVLGPVVIGADTRLGTGHGPMDPGPGGWLLVDQEASAITPPGLLARRTALAACEMPAHLNGDALWIDLCAQIRAQGARLVWTPDVSFVIPPGAASPTDGANLFRAGSPAARALPWADPYHHPALSLHGDLLAAETRTGLVRAAPADPMSLLMSGEAAQAGVALNAARALRRSGFIEADWVQDLPGAGDLGRRAPDRWVRVNPLHAPSAVSPPYTALFTTMPEPDIQPALAAAARIFATSPDLLASLRKLAPEHVPTALWRPALSNRYWRDFEAGKGLNTKPRVLWMDEGIAPSWFLELVNETLETVSWIAVERQGGQYAGAVARIAPQDSEQAWAQALAQLGPQIMVRPAASQTHADHYPALLAAAAGCRLLVDNRLDLPASLEALCLPNRKQDWATALQNTVSDLPATLRQGARTRAAALALPTLEAAPPAWAQMTAPACLASAAE